MPPGYESISLFTIIDPQISQIVGVLKENSVSLWREISRYNLFLSSGILSISLMKISEADVELLLLVYFVRLVKTSC